MLNKDFKEMLQCLLDAKVEFLLVGGYAMAAHGYPRATKDIDLWVLPDPHNAVKVLCALAAFGAAMEQISATDLTSAGSVLHLGVPPRRIDIITVADGVDFATCQANAVMVEIGGIQIPLISVSDLIANKLASGRPQDLVDAETLQHS